MGNRTPRPKKRPRKASALATWIDATGLAQHQLAKLLGCSKQALTNWKNGHTKPGRESANKIAEVSKGAVPASTWDDL